MEITMTSNESKNEMLVMVLTDLAAICQKTGRELGSSRRVVRAGSSIRRGIQFAFALPW
jgi:hypothetical protein